jgi:predicted nucleic acid-binding protein
MRSIADTGLIVALLDADDPFHPWAAEAFGRHSPFFTCDAVVAEACSFFRAPMPVLKLLTRGDLVLDFDLKAEMANVFSLAAKYTDRSMDLADACVVRMTELSARCKV